MDMAGPSAASHENVGNSRGNHSSLPLGADSDVHSHGYHAKNGSPGENLAKVIEMMGGIDSVIVPQYTVISKPNAQWWNLGTSNTDTLRACIEPVLGTTVLINVLFGEWEKISRL